MARPREEQNNELERELEKIKKERERLLKEKSMLNTEKEEKERKDRLRQQLDEEKRKLELEKEELENLKESVGEAQKPEQEKPRKPAPVQVPEQAEPPAPSPKRTVIELSAHNPKAALQNRTSDQTAHKFSISKRYFGIGEFTIQRQERADVVSKTKKLIRFG